MIKKEGFQLKPIGPDNLPTVFEWRNSERIKSLMYTDHNISWEEHITWYDHVVHDTTKLVYLLYYKNDPLGVVNIRDIDHEHGRCYWGFYIGKNTAPKGSGTMMGILALDKIFNEIGIRKLCSEVIHTNTGSLRYHEKLGFAAEGRFVQHMWKDHHYVDVIPMALFAETWANVKDSISIHLGGTS